MERHPDIARLIRLFYGRAREDALIGPVFGQAIHDWEAHLRALTAFWAAQLRGRGTYRGQPVAPISRWRSESRPACSNAGSPSGARPHGR
jgi:hemoglobin